MSARAYRVFLPFFLAIYCGVGFMTHTRLGGLEIYPFFAWALYSDAPRVEVQYTALLLEVDGVPLQAPLDLLRTPAFHDLPDYWRDAAVVARFGAALDAGDALTAARYRRLVEANILPRGRVGYEMVKRTYDPLKRRASGAFEETRLGRFARDGAGEPGR